jgi:vacuolar-type H+-ATPase subunit I/STV1
VRCVAVWRAAVDGTFGVFARIEGGSRMTASRITDTAGWLSFAGIVAFVVGVFTVIDGLVALFRNDYYLVTSQDILVFNFTAWGWIWLILGLAQIAIGIGLLGSRPWARTAGVLTAVLVAIGQLAFLRAFPVWSVIVIAMCVLLMYALTARPRTYPEP